ncbi:DNA internalization-related competence protein ComEC/Rec2 [Marinobacterium aestuariivivens]|uniref:DNA internalization-related competence protein ComEC/Rec2 n=1 Tax=Marinobacterium aestuariivivens TaxID=1698799 RepID=A0ABW2A530_9GAMM
MVAAGSAAAVGTLAAPGTAFWLGLLLAVTHGHWQLWHRLDPALQGRDHRLVGEVTGLPVAGVAVQRFELRVLEQQGSRLRRVRLSWYDPEELLRPGDIVELDVRLKPPRGLWNPGAFDYERWALARGIDAGGYVRAWHGRRGHGWSIDRWRAALAARLYRGIEDPSVSALARALLLGDRNGLDSGDWEQLRRTGTVHLLVVSGLHIGILVGVGWLLGRGLCRLFPADRAPAVMLRLVPVLTALLLSGVYVLLAGSGLATQRAWMMAAALLLSGFWLRPLSVWQRWWLALGLVLTTHPLAAQEAGLWLSFGAVAILLLLSMERSRQRLWRRLLRVQLAVFCLMAPLLLGWFAQLSLIGPLVNVVAIPLLPLLILGLVPLLLGLWSGVAWPVELYVLTVGWLWDGLGWLAHWPGAALMLPVAPWPLLAFALVAALVLVLPLGPRPRLAALSIWLLALFLVPSPASTDRFRVWVFDVGQGLAVLVEAGGRRLLYDTGPAYVSGNAAFERAVLPYLQRNGIERLDRLVISHADNDHAGGRAQVLQWLDVGRRETGSPALRAREGYGVCRAGQQWRWGEVRFRYLHGGEGVNENDRSCVLLIEAGDCRLLLTGDIEAPVERRLVDRGQLQPVTWLVASHHGSRSSSIAPFLQILRPGVGLFSAGYLNPYGHPAAEVVERFRRFGIETLNTAEAGAIELRAVRDGQCRLRAWRDAKKRYWSE